MTYLSPPPFTMLRTSYSANNVVWYGGNNIVLGGRGGGEYKVSKIFARDCLYANFKQTVFLMLVEARKCYPISLLVVNLYNVAQQQ